MARRLALLSTAILLAASYGCFHADDDGDFGVCGNADVDPSEECDLGAYNADVGLCKSDCTMQSCGDGFVGPSEECEDGNLADDDGCVADCKLATCGDGHIEVGVEECDDGNLADDDGCDSSCMEELNLVFVSAAEFSGNLGGIEGADAKCQALAIAAELPGTYLAWISTDAVSPAGRFVKSTKPYYRVDGTKIADNWIDLIDGTLAAPINVTEFGLGDQNGAVWTNTNDDGTVGSFSCLDWTNAGDVDFAYSGYSGDMDANWTVYSDYLCAYALRLYCFRQ